jgi:hypothetical protein
VVSGAASSLLSCAVITLLSQTSSYLKMYSFRLVKDIRLKINNLSKSRLTRMGW